MLKKRLIGVITVKDGWAVQSFGYNRYLPLGRPEILAENLDRWGVDEICVICIDRGIHGLGPDFSLLKKLSSRGLSTPLTFGGGIRTLHEAAQVIRLGAERLCLDFILRSNPNVIYEMSELLGAQALVAAIPLSMENEEVFWYDYSLQRNSQLTESSFGLFKEGIISEALIIDWKHEGFRNSFDGRLADKFPLQGVPLILFGGISESEQVRDLLSRPRVVGVAIGNSLNYTEHAVQNLKMKMGDLPVRPSVFFEND